MPRILRRATVLMLAALAVLGGAHASTKPAPAAKPKAAASAGFAAFIAALWPDAQARGVSRATFDRAFDGVTPDPKIAVLTRKQAEFSKPVWSYIANSVTGDRIARGRDMRERWGDTLARAQQAYGVPAAIVLGIWGMETNYGSFTGGMDVIRSLATLAHLKYRGDFFRNELLTALTILEKRQANRDALRGSWAGAMGQTQFMPSSFVAHAVDFDGDGRRDIWSPGPDALGSTAAYLKNFGWISGLPWGVEVTVPAGFDYRAMRDSFAGWTAKGFVRADGQPMPSSGEAQLLMLAGVQGPAFLVTANYDVIKKYNSSDAYALAVAHLGDRIMGRGALHARWPAGAKVLSHNDRVEVQRRLKGLGHYTGEVDGRFGTASRDAVRRYQLAAGYTPADGYADAALLARLRKAK